MKRIIILIAIICLILSGCGMDITPDNDIDVSGGKSGICSAGVWLSFSEIGGMLSSPDNFKNEVQTVVDNCKISGIENVYLHIRSHCDSLYPSKYFPLTENAKNYQYDVFKFMIDTFHNDNINVHAWINPYRVSTATSNTNDINSDSPIHKWLGDASPENDKNVCIYNGIYLNPAEEDARRLVIDGIKEIIENYNVDGIHFDDYFYPTTDAGFDSKSYEEYKNNTAKPLELADWRRANVNLLISGTYSAIKYANEDIIFSISPAASIENNYNSLYADVKSWVKDGIVDVIIPQLYFGFNYPDSNYRFKKLLSDWKRLMSCNKEVELIIGLASYKIGTDSPADSTEWQTENDIIARQVKLCYEDDRAEGYVLFSYSSVFSNEELNLKQRENLLKFNEEIKWKAQ